jgi:hypothetical protein
MLIGHWWESQKERDHYEDLGVGGKMTIKWVLEKWDSVVWTGLIWLMMTGGELI